MSDFRKVKVVERGDSWHVEYVDRKPRQRFLAAQFHKSIKTRAEVVEWVFNNPKLIAVL